VCGIIFPVMILRGKRAVVTGGSRGIGLAVARAFAREGADVVICGRNADALVDAASLIRSQSTARVWHHVCDVADLEDVRRFASFVGECFPALDVLVNNASVLGVRAPIADYPEHTWVEVMNVNINGQFFITKALLPLLLRSSSASIINVSSGAGKRPTSNWGAYAVSKFALEGFTQVLSVELKGHGVRVNAVNPGGTRTAMRAVAYPMEDPMTLPTPDDLTPLFVYLASDDSADVTGQSIEARQWLGLR